MSTNSSRYALLYFDREFVGSVEICSSYTRQDIERVANDYLRTSDGEQYRIEIIDNSGNPMVDDPICIDQILYLKVIRILTVTNNNLASLPPLPTCLRYLDCSDNKLTSIPDIPTVQELD